MSTIGERVDALLETVLALRRELGGLGHRVGAASPDFVRLLAAEPGRLGPQPMGQPYGELAPGFAIGFRKGAKPDLHVSPTAEGALEIGLRQRTSSGWITIEMDWDQGVFLEKRKVTLILRGSSPAGLTLTSLVRCPDAAGTNADLPGRPIELGPEPALHAVEFLLPDGAAPAEAKACRVILFCPVEPFAMTLTELSLL